MLLVIIKKGRLNLRGCSKIGALQNRKSYAMVPLACTTPEPALNRGMLFGSELRCIIKKERLSLEAGGMWVRSELRSEGWSDNLEGERTGGAAAARALNWGRGVERVVVTSVIDLFC